MYNRLSREFIGWKKSLILAWDAKRIYLWKSLWCIMVKWSPSESPMAITASGFGLGTSLRTPFTMIPPRLYHRLSHFARSIEGLMMMWPYWGLRIKLAEQDGPSTVPANIQRPTRRVCSIAKWTSLPDCFLTISSVWASDRDYTLLCDITGGYKEEGRGGVSPEGCRACRVPLAPRRGGPPQSACSERASCACVKNVKTENYGKVKEVFCLLCQLVYLFDEATDMKILRIVVLIKLVKKISPNKWQV